MEKSNMKTNKTESEGMKSMSDLSRQESSSNPLAGVAYSNPAGTEYPVIAYNNDMEYLINHPIENVSIEEVMAETLDTIKSCGFNTNIFVLFSNELDNWRSIIESYYIEADRLGLRTISDMSNMIPILNQAYAYTLGTPNVRITNGITYNPSLDKYSKILNIKKEMSNLWGFCIASKPEFISWGYDYLTAPLNSTVAGGTPDLNEAYRTYMQNMNQHPAYFNFEVSAARKYIGNEISDMDASDMVKYVRYLETLIDRFNLPMLSVNVFPILKSNTAPFYTVYEDYYFILESLGRFSVRLDFPLWMHMLCAQLKIYKDGSTVVEAEYPLPTQGILRFQAMNAIAFGFQGLVFWPYCIPENLMQKDSSTGASIPKVEFINVPYNEDGFKTDIYLNCAAVIPGIKLYGKALTGARFLEAQHVYGPAYVGDKFRGTSEFVSNMGCFAHATASGSGFVITRMDKGQEKYVVIVSHDPYNAQDITLTIYARCRWTEYIMIDWDDSSLTEKVHDIVNHEETVTRTLQPGGILLIRYERL